MLLRTMLFSLFCAICVLCTSCTLDSFLFSSTEVAAYNVSQEIIHDSLQTLVTFTSEGYTLYGVYCKQPDTNRVKPHPTIIYHHGNEKNIEFYWHRVELLYKAGFDVFIYDYRGYGMSEGTGSATSLFADGLAATNYVLTRTPADTAFIVHYGFSLGGVPAIHCASNTPSSALITEAIFASGQELVRSGTLLNIPASFLLDGSYNNLEAITNVKCKTLLIHGTADTYISATNNALPLFEKVSAQKQLYLVPNADHETIPETLGEVLYQDIITAFVRGR